MVKERLMDVAREYKSTGCNGKTLTKGESQGIKSLMKRIKEGELVVMETDKSGKFTVLSQEKYK